MGDIVVKLEAILNEFYNQSTSNFRKKEIELDLRTFQDCDSSWSLALSICSSNFNNQYLWFFATSTLEMTITKTWNKLDAKAKAHIRDTLWLTYSNFPADVGAMQRDRIAQLIALIAKRQPEVHGPFCQQILRLLKSNFLLGITLLKATFGEINSTKYDCSYEHKKNFVQGMTISLSVILPVLNKFLTLCVHRVQNNDIVFSSSDEYMNTSLPNNDKFIFCCNELLSCISSIFLWSSNCELGMTSELFNNIFELCMFNTSDKFVSIHVAALMTISELFYLQRKLPVPHIISLGITKLLKQRDLTRTVEEYQDKLCSLLKLFLTQQWTRFVNSKEFPTREFLLYLFNFTFADGISALTFAERLVIWKPIIQSFNEKEAGRYSETIVQLISNVYKKMQFQYEEQLRMLDTEDLLDTEQTENGQIQTELQFFLDNCIDTLKVAAQVEPCKIFDLIYNEMENFHVFFTFLNSLPDFSKDGAKIQANLGDVLTYFSKLKPLKQPFSLNYLIRDLSTLLLTITQLSSVVLVSTDERSHSIQFLIRSCILALTLSNRKKFYLYNLNDQSVTTDLVELQAQLLTSVRSLLLLKNDIYEDHVEVFNLISSVTELLLPREALTEPLLVSNSAASLMLTISSQIRPKFILNQPQFIELLQSDLSNHTDLHLRLGIKRIVFNSLLLPYNKIPVNQIELQEYEKRSHLLAQYVLFISNHFLNMGSEDDQQLILEQLKELSEFEEILKAFEDTNTISKQMLLAALNEVINKAIVVFQKFGTNPIVYLKIVNFFLSVVRCLQLQLGSNFVIEIIRMILGTTTILQGNSEALNKLLQMLIFVVQSGSSANSLINDILKMTLDEMLPLERSQSGVSIDISSNLYSLYAEILQNLLLQKPQALGMSSGRITDQRNYQDDLLKLFYIYGECLCNGATGQDSSVIRIILNSLEKLNQTCRLYEKVFFKNFLLKDFLICLIRLVISESGISYCDQIVSIIFHMAEKNKSVLLESFTSIGLSEENTIQLICDSNDLPTFASLMQNLIHDALYSQLLHI